MAIIRRLRSCMADMAIMADPGMDTMVGITADTTGDTTVDIIGDTLVVTVMGIGDSWVKALEAIILFG